jgi:hypothetical protein
MVSLPVYTKDSADEKSHFYLSETISTQSVIKHVRSSQLCPVIDSRIWLVMSFLSSIGVFQNLSKRRR